jgi:hypothetical protein
MEIRFVKGTLVALKTNDIKPYFKPKTLVAKKYNFYKTLLPYKYLKFRKGCFQSI